MKCQLLVTTEKGPIVAGIISLSGGQLLGQAEKGYENLIQNVIKERNKKQHVEEWFNHLPTQFSGSYLRANIIGVEKGWVTLDDGRHVFIEDDHGTWAETSGAFEMYSPNTEENLKFEQAVARLDSEDQARFKIISNDIDHQLNLKVDTHNAIGDWSDGAENSVFTYVAPDGNQFDTVRYSTALKGYIAHQKQAIAFNIEKDGTDSVYRFSVNADVKDVRSVLDKNGLQFRTLLPSKGKTEVIIFDPGTQLKNNIGKVVEHYDSTARQFRGKGEFIGGETRAEGRKEFKRIIEAYEQSHTRRYRRTSGGSISDFWDTPEIIKGWVTLHDGRHVFIDDSGEHAFNFKEDKPTEQELSGEYGRNLINETKENAANLDFDTKVRANSAAYFMNRAMSYRGTDPRYLEKIVLRDNQGRPLGAVVLSRENVDVGVIYLAANPNIVMKTPGWPKGGVGTTLMARIADVAKEHGNGVVLSSWDDSSDKFYNAIGMHKENPDHSIFLWNAKEAAAFSESAKRVLKDSDQDKWVHYGLLAESKFGPPLAGEGREKVQKGWVTLHDGRHVFIENHVQAEIEEDDDRQREGPIMSEKQIRTFAKEQGFDPKKVEFEYSSGDYVTIAEYVSLTPNAMYSPQTGIITVWPKMVVGQERPILVHEIFHDTFQKAISKDSVIDNPNYQPHILASEFLHMRNPYISKYTAFMWHEYANGAVPITNAITETLSEMARIKYITGKLPGSKLWRDFYNLVDKEGHKAFEGDFAKVLDKTEIKGKPAIIVYFKDDFIPTNKDDAEFVKIIFDDGTIMFATLGGSGQVIHIPELDETVVQLKESANKLAKARRNTIRAGRIQPSSNDAMNRISKVLEKILSKMEDKVMTVIKSFAITKVFKKAEDDELNRALDAALKKLSTDFASIPEEIRNDLIKAVQQGVIEGANQVSISSQDVISKVNEQAYNWANDRAAELVGMKWTEGGQLIENPNAEWAITDSTRNQLRIIIRDVFNMERPSMQDLADRIQKAGTFSEARAKMIAKTEVIRAEVVGNLNAWQESGKVTKVNWLLSGDHDVEDECDDLADGGPYDIDDVPDFPAHPNCECVLSIAEIQGE